MEDKLLRLVIILAFILTQSGPAILPASDCMHTYSVGYWFSPCHTYDWQCEFCGPCLITCTYRAVLIICHDEQGREYWLSATRDWFCLGPGIPI